MNQTKYSEDINPLLIPLLAAIETGLNQLFALDPETFERLGRFKGKIIAFHFTDVEQTLYFFPDQQGIQVVSHYDDDADTVISGSIMAFARMAMADEKTKTKAVFKGDISIAGDITLGQHFQSLFKQLDIDWEEHVSHITGDVIAHSLGNMARGFLGWSKDAFNSLSMDVSEYVQYETRDIASGPEINHFNRQIDQIRSDVDRAEARINRLFKTIDNKKSAE
ncbi:MAG: SCP2 sterol-binding domain-containing protein [Gammaproteobacteria bacterium]|nr:SCP2 sterol-binding domain-containing protein [Gammaproteobacteria bacterium]